MAVVVVVLALFGAVPPVSDAVRGGASVSGIVLTTDETPQPVRRAIVSMRGDDFALGHHAVTDDDGRFQIADLPAGTYRLSAKRPAFVTIEYGASRPERPGAPIALAAGQQLTDVRVRIARGSVVSGTVRDGTGAPQSDVVVYVERPAPTGDARIKRYEKTDRHGMYRVYGLAAGTYTVWVQPQMTSPDAVYARSDAEVDAILSQLQQGGLQAPLAMTTVSVPASPQVSDFAPIYYPDAFSEDDATPVVLGTGEARTDVDVTVRLMPRTQLSGRVSANGAGPMSGVHMALVRASRRATTPKSTPIHPDGTFQFSGVAPGRYQIVARRLSPSGRGAAPCEFAAADIEVTSPDVPEVLLVLRPCLRIVARVELADASLSSATFHALAGTQLLVEPDRSTGMPMDTLPAVSTLGTDGRFRFGGGGGGALVPGAYLIRATVPGGAPDRGWWLESARTPEGRDILDSPLVLTDDSPETTNVVLTFSDRHASLSGVLQDTSLRPALSLTVIAFTTNREWWRPPFRRVLTARPATDGRFTLHDLPPGEYYLAALNDVAPDEWRDRAFLELASRLAIRVTILPGEKKVQSLQVRSGGRPSR